MLIGEILEKSARNYSDKEALIQEDLRLTYRQLNERVNRLANRLFELGLKKGDRIAILAKNSVHYMELFFAIGRLGGIVVPINWRLEKDELTYILKDSIPNALFFTDEFAAMVQGLKGELETIRHYILIDGKRDWALSFEDLVREGASEAPEVDLSVDDIAIQFYTGGTTARPKGVLWSHRTVHYHCLHACLGWDFSTDMVMLVLLPLFHQTGAHTLAVHYIGGTAVVLPKFDVQTILKTIEKERITYTLMVPTTIIMLVEHPDVGKYDLSSLKRLQYGGSPMYVKPLEKALRVLKCDFSQSYGMTEAPLVTRLTPDDHIVSGSEKKIKRLYSVGRLSHDVAGIKIVDKNDNELGVGQTGEIAVKLPSQMLGYWQLPEETEKTLKNGWVYTGDLGYFDEDGYLFLTERKKDIIISGGENVSAKEVEEVIYTHPSVLEVAVVGAPDELWGESVRAVVVLRQGQTASVEELIQYCRKRLAGFKTPKGVDFVPSLPKSTVGKILKRDVRKTYWPDLQ